MSTTPARRRPSVLDRVASEVAHSPFGADRFGRLAERFARLFGTPQFIVGQTVLVAVWIALNAVAVSMRWDPYPFILLNLAFSTQAAYAAPLILLAQTRQADRDEVTAAQDSRVAEEQRAHVEQQTAGLRELLRVNTELTERIALLTEELYARQAPPSSS
ncbi:DUF1003 domain-containing protein [Patulibacter sp.]|uniref:DUF1003 domain-containing protein n=1 Tax=Patulibacter sp. TaxID=1912859 RepID=UPI002721DA13|nr:DUF1003 domain-containing protein [Patulibacter sp.]MDO9410882.1 DUF1003 domain-containing protein [Patulibacter sp.]